MTDSRMKDRVRGLIAGTAPVNDPPEQTNAPAESNAQRQALQVLNLAQRTAEEHIANAQREADRIRANAGAKAEEIVRDAQTHAHGLRKEADKTLTDARETAQQTARDAQAHAEKARRSADKVLADARVRAEEAAKDAQANADELKHQAQQRYDDVVGSLAAKREALQQQIEALEQFDQEYRARLTTFMQAQLRALWVDQPQVSAEIEQPAAPVPAQKSR